MGGASEDTNKTAFKPYRTEAYRNEPYAMYSVKEWTAYLMKTYPDETLSASEWKDWAKDEKANHAKKYAKATQGAEMDEKENSNPGAKTWGDILAEDSEAHEAYETGTYVFDFPFKKVKGQ